MKPVVEHAFVGQLFQRWGRDAASRHRELPEADIIQKNQQDVGSALWCRYLFWKLRRIRIHIGGTHVAAELLICVGQYRLSL